MAIIETERLILRPWTVEDIDDLVEGLNNIEVSKWLASVPFPYTYDDAKAFVEYANSTNNLEFAIVLKAENKVIGATEISNINKEHKTAGGGIWLNSNYHGCGYGKEAFNARIDYAFNTLGLRKILNGYFPGNECSKKMQESLGYKQEGIRKRQFISMATGEEKDEIITALFKEDWIH